MSSNLLRVFVRFALFFEPISPRFISFWLRRRLKDWKDKGLISDYKVTTERTGKFHYKILLDLELSEQQVEWVLDDTLLRIFGGFGR